MRPGCANNNGAGRDDKDARGWMEHSLFARQHKTQLHFESSWERHEASSP